MNPRDEQAGYAREVLAASGRDPDLYAIDVEFQAPDPDGGGMFTQYYDVTVRNRASGGSVQLVAGIGTGWTGQLAQAIRDGKLD